MIRRLKNLWKLSGLDLDVEKEKEISLKNVNKIFDKIVVKQNLAKIIQEPTNYFDETSK